MKELSLPEQRKLYEMYEEAVNKEASHFINYRILFGIDGDSENILRTAEDNKSKFLSFLEDGVVKK